MKNGLIIDKSGNKRYYLNDELHRVDGPAEEWSDGDKSWYVNGKLHRVDGPALEYSDGSTFWYLHDKKHRVDGPAVEWSDGNKFWFLNGKTHREDGPAVEYKNGDTHWYLSNRKVMCPEEFKTMEEFSQKLNDSEDYSLQWISDIDWVIEVIKSPTGKQTRLHAMRWKI